MPTYTTECLVLARRDLGENDRCITVLTREFGKRNFAIRGARRGSSKVSGATEPFTRLKVLAATGKSIDVITQCEITAVYSSLRATVAGLAGACYLCEVVDALLHEHDEQSAAAVFNLICHALNLMQQPARWPDAVMNATLLRLMAELGYAPRLDTCCCCEEPLDGGPAGFSASNGGTVCRVCSSALKDAVALSAETIALIDLLGNAGAKVLTELKPLDRPAALATGVIQRYVQYHAGRTIKSSEFLHSIRAGGG